MWRLDCRGNPGVACPRPVWRLRVAAICVAVGGCDGGDEATLAAPPDVVERIYAGESLVCARTSKGAVWCWGDSYFGQGAFQGIALNPQRVDVVDRAEEIRIGAQHACFLREATVYCMGDNSYWQLGRDGPGGIEPQQVDGLGDVIALNAGVVNSCGLQDGCATCWGVDNHTPACVADGAAALSSGSPRCIIGLDDSVRCWGPNQNGQVGAGVVGGVYASPVAVVGARPATQVSCGGFYSCSLTLEGSVQCWGDGEALGNGSDSPTATGSAIDVIGLEQPALRLEAGTNHVCALMEDRTVMCWGGALLGDGSGFSSTPVRADVPAPVVDIALGNGITCALTEERRVWCWGDSHATGTGSYLGSPVPVPVIWPDVEGVPVLLDVDAG